MLGLPQSTEFNKRIPKQKFYEHITVSPALKKSFVDQIRMIYWRNKVAATTVNLAPGTIVDEVEVFEQLFGGDATAETLVDLIDYVPSEKDGEYINTVVAGVKEHAEQIDREISYHIIFLLEYEGKLQAWTAYKEKTPTANAVFKVGKYYHTEWMTEAELPIRIDGLNLDTVYENFVRQIAGDALKTDSGESLKASVERDEKKKQLEKQITVLENKMRREKQLNRQMEMNAELKKYKGQLIDLR